MPQQSPLSFVAVRRITAQYLTTDDKKNAPTKWVWAPSWRYCPAVGSPRPNPQRSQCSHSIVAAVTVRHTCRAGKCGANPTALGLAGGEALGNADGKRRPTRLDPRKSKCTNTMGVHRCRERPHRTTGSSAVATHQQVHFPDTLVAVDWLGKRVFAGRSRHPQLDPTRPKSARRA